MKRIYWVMYAISIFVGAVGGYLLIPDSFSDTRKIAAGVFTGLGCTLILTAGRIYRPKKD